MIGIFKKIIYFKRWFVANRKLKKINLKPSLTNLSESLDKVIRDVEDDFISLGTKIQNLNLNTSNLGKSIKEASLTTGGDGTNSGLFYVSMVSEKMVDGLVNYRKMIADNLATMDSIIRDLNSLVRYSKNNEKVATLLNVIALNIAIESNRSDQAKEMFKAFVSEIRELAKKIKAISLELCIETEEVIIKQKGVRKAVALKLNDFFVVSQSAEEIVTDTSKLIRNMIDTSLESIENAATCSEEISQKVGSIVMAIQFHDIVRQKAEHVVSAIKEVSELSTSRWLKGKDIRRILTVLKLQTEQIKLIMSEVEKAQFDIENGCEIIRERSENLKSVLNEMESESVGEVSEETFLKMASELRELDKLTERAKELNSEMEQIKGGASQSAEILGKYVNGVENFSLDLQRKALNAIIKSAHLGNEGETLEIFAVEVTKTADDSNGFAETVKNIVESITERTINDEAISLEEESEFEDRGNRSEMILDLYRNFVTKKEEASQSYLEIEVYIEKTKKSFEFLPGFLESIKDIYSSAENIANNCNEGLKGFTDFSKDVDELMEEFKGKYTMESERAVHAGFIEEKKELTDISVEKKEEEDGKKEEEDFGDNVDLF